MFGKKNIGIDLGTASILVHVAGEGVVIREPSVLAVDRNTGEIIKFGREAYSMIGRAPEDIQIIRPLRGGVVNQYEPTSKLIEHYLKKACNGMIFNPRVMICTPSNTSDVEQKAVKDSAFHAGAKEIYLIEEPLAAAFGAGVPIDSHKGHMIVDIGGGTTDIAVIVNGHVIVSDSVKVAGDRFNEDIARYVRRKYNLLIGEKTAEQLKFAIGWVYTHKQPSIREAKGRSLDTGLPKKVEITSFEMLEALSPSLGFIIGKISDVLVKTPPEIVPDIFENGIILTGGGSLLKGLPDLIRRMTGINTRLAQNPLDCVAKGTGEALRNLKHFSDDIAASRNGLK